MDTSPEYIEMCKKAEEIQRYYYDFESEINMKDSYNNNSFFASESYSIKCKNCNYELYNDEKYCPYCGKKTTRKAHHLIVDVDEKSRTWLPRQDQLQDMMNPKHGSLLWKWEVAKSFYDRLNKQELNKILFLDSDEQYWLFLVMNQKYNKTWNKETKEWEIIK